MAKGKLIVLCSVFTILIAMFTIRVFAPIHLDDVSPLIPCSEELLKKADVYYVIPMFHNLSIATNQTWCIKIMSNNKTIAMHGVFHSYNEFAEDLSEQYLMKGAKEFEKCFGYLPNEFKPPQLAISANNKKMIKNNYKIETWLSQRFHKVYHCNDTGMFPNWLADII